MKTINYEAPHCALLSYILLLSLQSHMLYTNKMLLSAKCTVTVVVCGTAELCGKSSLFVTTKFKEKMPYCVFRHF
jgi:hypothetical protein